MRLVVVGAGMYVTGRGTDGLGCILASLAQLHRGGFALDEVLVTATKEDNRAVVDEAAAETNRLLGSELRVRYQVGGLDALGDFDAAIVSVPDHLHHDIGAQVIDQGLHCLMVKPFTPTLAEGQDLVDRATATGVYGMVEFHKRFDPQNRIVARMLAAGELGRLSFATVGFSQRIGVPLSLFRDWAERSNAFQYLGVHYVDLLHHLTGMRPRRVSASGSRGILAARGVDTFDAVCAQVIWEDDEGREVPQQLAVHWIDPMTSTAMSDQRYALFGERGRIECDQKNRGLTATTTERVESINPSFAQLLATAEGGLEYAGYGPTSIQLFVRDVARLRAGEITPADLEGQRPTFRDALVSTAVVDAANRSLAAEGRWEAIA